MGYSLLQFLSVAAFKLNSHLDKLIDIVALNLFPSIKHATMLYVANLRKEVGPTYCKTKIIFKQILYIL